MTDAPHRAVRDAHLQHVANPTDRDLRAGDDIVLDPTNGRWGVHGQPNGWWTGTKPQYDTTGIEQPVYTADDDTRRQVDNDTPTPEPDDWEWLGWAGGAW